MSGSSAPDPIRPDSARRRRLRLLAGPDDALVVTELLRSETVGGVLMLAAAAAAVVWASLGHASYLHVQHLSAGPLTLEEWAADGLLAVFFFLAGLELKRELIRGALSRPADAALPVVAAVAGMIVPAGLYLVINLAAPGGDPRGWAVPMATDIAFALAVLAVVAPGLPGELRAFLLTLAIADDLGSIIVIAVAFTATVHLWWLLAGALCVTTWWLLQWRRLDWWWPYPILFVIGWWCLHASGVHATLAGVAFGLATRAERAGHDDPVERWERRWRPVSAGVAVPAFALLSAGVSLRGTTLVAVFTHPATLGIMVALIVGKTIGVFGGSWLTARLSRADLHAGLRWRDVFSASILAGIGFTVALLISNLSFTGEIAEHAKAAVLIGSLTAGALATVSLRRRVRERREPHERQPLG